MESVADRWIFRYYEQWSLLPLWVAVRVEPVTTGIALHHGQWSIDFVPGGSHHLLIFFFLPFKIYIHTHWPYYEACWILVLRRGDQTYVPCREAHSSNHLDHKGIPWPHHLKTAQESLWASCTKRKQIYLSYFCIFLMFLTFSLQHLPSVLHIG